MCRAVEDGPDTLEFVPGHLKTQEMCEKAVEQRPYLLGLVPDYFKTKEMCEKTVKDDPSSLQYVTDWFVGRGSIDVWYDDDYDEIIEWYEGYKEIIEWYEGYEKRKAQKAKIKEELLAIAWHPSRWWDWCMSEDEKKETEKLWKYQIVVFKII